MDNKTKRYIIKIGESTHYQLGLNSCDALYEFMNKNRGLDYKNVSIEEDTSPEIPVEHHIILERLDKMVEEIFEIRKILNKWRKVEVRVPDDGC
jgi:hypothetical protein